MSELSMHSLHSTLRERIVEHVFVGEALRTLWRRGVTDVEVLRSEFDAHGYDLVMARGQIVRHIQFKTGVRQKPAPVSVGRALADKPSGCVIWILVSLGLDLGPFWWFGAAPGEPLPDLSSFASPKRIGRRETGERPLRVNHSNVPASMFRRVETISEVLELLFGNLPFAARPTVLEDTALRNSKGPLATTDDLFRSFVEDRAMMKTCYRRLARVGGPAAVNPRQPIARPPRLFNDRPASPATAV